MLLVLVTPEDATTFSNKRGLNGEKAQNEVLIYLLLKVVTCVLWDVSSLGNYGNT